MKDILEFQGINRWLSNFWTLPQPILFDGEFYPTVEHAYQAAKTLDKFERTEFTRVRRPGDAKRLGRSVTLRLDWEQVKIQIMRELLIQKFSNPELRIKLLNTHPCKLVEGNTWGDTFWGVCRGVGENHLGKLLMEIRDSLK